MKYLSIFLVLVLVSTSLVAATKQPTSYCIGSVAQWWTDSVNVAATASSLAINAEVFMKLQASSDEDYQKGIIEWKIVQKEGAVSSNEASLVGVHLIGSYAIGSENFTVGDLTCDVTFNQKYGEKSAICSKFTKMFGSQSIQVDFSVDCSTVTVTGKPSTYYKKGFLLTSYHDPNTGCDLRGPTTNADYWWVSTFNRAVMGHLLDEDLYLKVSSDYKTFTATQVAGLNIDSDSVKCSYNKLIATVSGNFTYDSVTSAFYAETTNCESIQGSDADGCNLCANFLLLKGALKWSTNGTCSQWTYVLSSGDAVATVPTPESFTFKVASTAPPGRDREITMLIIALAIIGCILVIFIPFSIIVVRDWKRYRDERLRSSFQHQQL